MKRKYKILHVITGLRVGGAEGMLLNLLRHMDDTQFSNSVISLKERGSIGYQLERMNVPVFYLNMKGLSSALALWRLGRTILSIQPDLIQGWMYHGNLYSLVMKVVTNHRCAVVWNIRRSVYDLAHLKLSTQIVVRICAALSYLPERIIYNAKVAENQHNLLGFRSTSGIIIPNGFNAELFQPSPIAREKLLLELELRPESQLIGNIDRFQPEKDHTNFLEAAAILTKSYPRAHFIMMGKDIAYENDKLMKIISKLKLRPKVYLLGERADLPGLLPALDLVTSSSFSEGFPNVIGEAISCGVPCVVTDVGASSELVDRLGVVVPPRDAKALASAMAQLLDLVPSKRQELGAAARKRIQDHYQIKQIVGAYESLYLGVLDSFEEVPIVSLEGK
ncbi:glycosyltransferase [Candidatus Acetothermia bacterium]|nr:glycosyltransferase [Candidatus Acetothermia bacterium]MBI3643578.1 glycosyltransferase [Candidatus Acetothermia bacterium]